MMTHLYPIPCSTSSAKVVWVCHTSLTAMYVCPQVVIQPRITGISDYGLLNNMVPSHCRKVANYIADFIVSLNYQHAPLAFLQSKAWLTVKGNPQPSQSGGRSKSGLAYGKERLPQNSHFDWSKCSFAKGRTVNHDESFALCILLQNKNLKLKTWCNVIMACMVHNVCIHICRNSVIFIWQCYIKDCE